MKILYSTDNLTVKERYDLTRNPNTEKMSDHVGETVAVDKYMVREEERGDTGELVRIVSIQSGNTFMATNSIVFCKEFTSILEMCAASGEKVNHIEITTGHSKKGREFITCVYID